MFRYVVYLFHLNGAFDSEKKPCRCHFMHIKKQTHGSDTEIKYSPSYFEI